MKMSMVIPTEDGRRRLFEIMRGSLLRTAARNGDGDAGRDQEPDTARRPVEAHRYRQEARLTGPDDLLDEPPQEHRCRVLTEIIAANPFLRQKVIELALAEVEAQRAVVKSRHA